MDTRPQASVYIVKDNGKRCVAPPCDHYDLFLADQPDNKVQSIHEVDLNSVVGDDDAKRGELIKRTFSPQGLKLEGTLGQRLMAGPRGDATVLHASRIVG